MGKTKIFPNFWQALSSFSKQVNLFVSSDSTSYNSANSGLFLGLVYYKTQSVSLCIISHFIMNLVTYLPVFY